MNKIIMNLRKILTLSALGSIGMAVLFSSCDFEYEIEESKSDETPPVADFSTTVDNTTREVTFGNLSSGAIAYKWTFGDGNTSEEKEPKHTYSTYGSYDVSLTATDALSVSSKKAGTVVVTEPPPEPEAIVPTIGEASFEDNDTTAPEAGENTNGYTVSGNKDGRDSWRISGGTIYGVTSSPTRTGSQAAKFEVAPENRLGYQEVVVTPETNYILTCWYTIKTSPAGSKVRLAVTTGGQTSADDAFAAIFDSVEGGDQTDANTYVKLELPFNSGNNAEIGILIDSNDIAESRVDDVSIALGTNE